MTHVGIPEVTWQREGFGTTPVTAGFDESVRGGDI